MNEKPFDIHKALDGHPILYKGNVVRDWKFFSGAQTVVVEYIEKDGRPHIANFDRFGQKIGTNPEHKLTLGSKLRYGIYSTDLKEMYPRTYDTKEQALRDCGTNEIPIPIDITVTTSPAATVGTRLNGSKTMAKKKMCILCGEKPATVPDRNRFGRLINWVCSSCHALQLAGDWEKVREVIEKRKAEHLRRSECQPE